MSRAIYVYIINDSVVLWKIQKFDWLILEQSDIHVCITEHFAVTKQRCDYSTRGKLIRSFRGYTSIAMSLIISFEC